MALHDDLEILGQRYWAAVKKTDDTFHEREDIEARLWITVARAHRAGMDLDDIVGHSQLPEREVRRRLGLDDREIPEGVVPFPDEQRHDAGRG